MKKWHIEVLRLLPLLGIASLILLPDDARHVIIFGVGIILLAVALAHGIRKILFHYIDVKELVEKAKENSIACAMIVLGLLYLLATIIQSLVALLR